MKNFDINTQNNYSRIGKTLAKIHPLNFDKTDKIKELLKNKDHKRYLAQDYFEKEDKDSFDDSKELNFEDIFDKNYKNHYSEILKQQKAKYFKFIKSCAFNKKLYGKEKKKNIRLKIQLNKTNTEKDNKHNKLIFLENNSNKDYMHRKLIYCQSFDKMIGRYDLEKKKKYIESKLLSIRNMQNKEKRKINSEINKNEEKTEERENELIQKDIPKNLENAAIKPFYKKKIIEKNYLPEYYNVKLRTIKGIRTNKRSPTFLKQLSSLSVYHDKKNNSLNKTRFFSSLNVTQKSNPFINDNKRLFEDNIKPISKRIFSGTRGTKDIKQSKINSGVSILNDKTPKKELNYPPEFGKKKRNISSYDFKMINTSKKTNHANKSFIFSHNSKSKTSINFHKIKTRNKHFGINSSLNLTHNSAISFKKMLSREYVNRVQVDEKIGAGMSLEPNYTYFFPKVVTNVKYSTKSNYTRKPQFREECGINIEEKREETDKNKNINFSKMLGRGNSNSEFPIYMNNIFTRNSFDSMTVKSLKMNHFSKRRLNSPTSSFNNKKSFNVNIPNNNLKSLRESIKKIRKMREKEIRIKNYNNNIKNIFKKVIYDDIIDKNEINDDIFDFKKNPKLMETINSYYKNLMLDYYKLNLDFLEKNLSKKKIDGITFKEIKSKNRIDNKNENNPYKINESEIKN